MNTNYSLTAVDSPDDLPRTLRRERDAQLARAQEREDQDRSSILTQRFGAYDPDYISHTQTLTPEPQPVAAEVTRLDVPFLHLMAFFIKAVFAAIPALFILGALLWLAGDVLQMLFPWLIKTQILIQFPN